MYNLKINGEFRSLIPQFCRKNLSEQEIKRLQKIRNELIKEKGTKNG